MIATICKSCRTVHKTIGLKRCTYCGSQCLFVQNVNEDRYKSLSQFNNARIVLKEVKNDRRNKMS